MKFSNPGKDFLKATNPRSAMSKTRIIGFAYLSMAVAMLTLALQGTASAVPVSVPELDPYTIGAGLTVFGGAAALLIERYRRRKR
jgi:hypothetical protein